MYMHARRVEGSVGAGESGRADWEQSGYGTLDVESAHAIAPGASIVLLTSPVDETQGGRSRPARIPCPGKVCPGPSPWERSLAELGKLQRTRCLILSDGKS